MRYLTILLALALAACGSDGFTGSEPSRDGPTPFLELRFEFLVADTIVNEAGGITIIGGPYVNTFGDVFPCFYHLIVRAEEDSPSMVLLRNGIPHPGFVDTSWMLLDDVHIFALQDPNEGKLFDTLSVRCAIDGP